MPATIGLGPSEIQELCQRYLGEQTSHRHETSDENTNFQVLGYKLKSTSDAPTGFLGRHQLLSVEIQIRDAAGKQRLEKIRFFTKSAPTDLATRMEYLEGFGVFKKEISVFKDVLPALQRIFGDIAPKCYYANDNLLVFENLLDQGYRMAAGRDGLLNYEHLNCAMKTLAALHAASIVYEVRQGKRIDQLFPEVVKENAYPSNITAEHVRSQNFNNANRVFVEFIKAMPKYQCNLEKILAELPHKMYKIFELAQPSKKYQNVFSHGDLWANNAMFKYGKFGESPIQCRLVDFQLARYAPPILDVITMLTIPTNRAFREQYLMELLNDYHSFIAEFLKREGLCIQDYLPQQQFFATVEEYRIAGLIESCLFSHMTVLPAESSKNLTSSADGFNDFFDSKRVQICMQAFRSDQLYRERITDMLEDLIDRFILN